MAWEIRLMDRTSRRYRPVLCLFATLAFVSLGSTGPAAQGPPAFSHAWQAGTPAQVTGVLTTVFGDDFDRGQSELHHFIRDERTGAMLGLRFEGGTPGELQSGARVTARGRVHESTLYVAASDGTGMTIQGATPTVSQATTGHRTIVIVANFRDANVTCSVQSITDMIFTDPNGRSVAALYRECSLGQLMLSGDVVGPYALDVSSTDPCNFNAWSMSADAQATAAGVELASYQHKFYVFPVSQCGAAGYGTISGNPSIAWVFQCGIRGVYAHELGHNLGMDHASTPTSEYDDTTDPMAISSGMLPGLNAPHRHQLGWYGATSVRLVEQEGLYDVAPLALDPTVATAPQILMIRKPDTNEYYYLSYRYPMGFDASIDGVFFYKLSIHRYKGDGSTARTYRLAGLSDGQSWIDQANGISVTMVSHGATHATASIAFACAAATPSLSLAPQSQSGSAGSSRSFTVAVSNRDGAACPTSAFALNNVVPAGWTGALSPSSLAIAPGVTAQATLTVTSAQTAPSGSYAVALNLADGVEPMHTSSASATFAVTPAADTTAPTAPSSLAATPNQKLKQIRLSWSAASDNVGVAGYRVWRDGAIVASPTGTGWSDSAVTAGQTYTYAVEAYDAAGNRSALSNSVTGALSGGKRR
jgi:hypothetical protein